MFRLPSSSSISFLVLVTVAHPSVFNGIFQNGQELLQLKRLAQVGVGSFPFG